MTRTRLADRPLARLGLVIAAVLHLLGGGLLPVLHSDFVPPGELAVHGHDHAGDDCLPPVANHVAHCTVCHALGAPALPGGVLRLPAPAPARTAAAGAPEFVSPFLRSLTAPARAPPAAA
jgi:hypothetical protein